MSPRGGALHHRILLHSLAFISNQKDWIGQDKKILGKKNANQNGRNSKMVVIRKKLLNNKWSQFENKMKFAQCSAFVHSVIELHCHVVVVVVATL